mmetsp:Transcript_47908/g.116539  ORF Transcript_47908/g.116539 Transcript_47908/m.116539 type:complete len:221 (-) Transcript_47908:529-1191(-)
MALFSSRSLRHHTTGRVLRSINDVEKMRICRTDLPFLAEGIGIFKDRLAVTGKHRTTFRVGTQHTDGTVVVFCLLAEEFNIDEFLEVVDHDLFSITHMDDVTTSVRSKDLDRERVVTNRHGEVEFRSNDGWNRVFYAVDQGKVFTVDLQDILTDLDSGTGSGRPGTIVGSADMDMHTLAVLVTVVLDGHQIACALEVVVLIGEGGEVGVADDTPGTNFIT